MDYAEVAWADPDSLTRKNAASIPPSARPCLAVFADMGSVCVVDPEGALRVFSHGEKREVRPAPWVIAAAHNRIRELYPDIAVLFVAGGSR